MKTQEEMLELLKKKYPKLSLKKSEEFSPNYKNGIWSYGDKELKAKDGFVLIDYYATNHTKKQRYEFGVHIELRSFLEKHGWYAEWYDVGTIMFWPI